MPATISDGVRIRYYDEGQGDPVLLIHGHTFDARVWDEVAAVLVAEERRVLRPDLRGHGDSDRPPKGYHVSHHAADMTAVLSAAGVSSAVVVGFSLGGGIGLELAVTEPHQVAGLVLVDPVMPDRPFEPAFFDSLRRVARSVREHGVRTAMLGPWLESPLFEGSFRSPGIRDRAAALVADFPGAEYLAEERDTVERDWKLPDRLGEIATPCRVLVGELDMPGFVAWAREAADGIPGARLEVVAGAGHLLPLERPDLVVNAVLSIGE